MHDKKLTAISLFSGAGGMDVGFEQAGIKILMANEIDKMASNTFIKNHPDTEMIADDINNIFPLLERFKDVDIVFGGPPCQGFSVIGKMNPDDARSQLIWSFLKAVEIINPRVFVMENVKALAVINKWRDIREEYIARAEKLGYRCIPFVINAAEYGTPQKRERVFFVGIKGETQFEEEFLNLLEKQRRSAPTIRELFKDLGPAGTPQNPRTCNAKITYAERPVMRKIPYDCLMFNGIGRPIDPDGYSRTITASQGGNMTLIVDEEYLLDPTTNNWIQEYYDKLVNGEVKPVFKEAPARLRRLTINETKRIQTFPDDYEFCGTKTNVYKQIGNAVPCEMARTVATAVVEYINMLSRK